MKDIERIIQLLEKVTGVTYKVTDGPDNFELSVSIPDFTTTVLRFTDKIGLMEFLSTLNLVMVTKYIRVPEENLWNVLVEDLFAYAESNYGNENEN